MVTSSKGLQNNTRMKNWFSSLQKYAFLLKKMRCILKILIRMVNHPHYYFLPEKDSVEPLVANMQLMVDSALAAEQL